MVTNNPIKAITGTSDAPVGSAVIVTVAGQTLTTTVLAGGTWRVMPTAIADGDYPVSASTVDEAGNVATATQLLTVDTVVPVIKINGARTVKTTDNTPTISGTSTAPAGSTVTVRVAGQTLSATVRADGTWTVIPTTIMDGTYPVTASITDAAGNTATETHTLVVDTSSVAATLNVTVWPDTDEKVSAKRPRCRCWG